MYVHSNVEFLSLGVRFRDPDQKRVWASVIG